MSAWDIQGERTNQIADTRVNTGDNVLNFGAIRDNFPFGKDNTQTFLVVGGVALIAYLILNRKRGR